MATTTEPKVCGRCGKVHTGPPFDEEKLISEMAAEIADMIDAEILQELLALRD